MSQSNSLKNPTNPNTAFQVSIIMPVFNAVKYLRQAVESAVSLPETGEIILIDDGSTDGALTICKELEKKYDKVICIQHPNGENRGAGASRNLGIQKSRFDFIAFLDADDYYLPNRFVQSKIIFESDETVEGVYEATGFFYHNENRLDPKELTTINQHVEPGELLNKLLYARIGHFTTDAITIRKTVLKKSGLFETALRLHQDTNLWYRLAYTGKLVAGNLLEAVAIRRVHGENRISVSNPEARRKYHIYTYRWFKDQLNVDKKILRKFFIRYMLAAGNNKKIPALFQGLKELVKTPRLAFRIF